jgi:hypothetical protein
VMQRTHAVGTCENNSLCWANVCLYCSLPQFGERAYIVGDMRPSSSCSAATLPLLFKLAGVAVRVEA